MKKVIFLDRDGVINFEPGDYTFKVDEFKIVDYLLESLKILKNKGYQFIVITNQGGISKQIYNHSDVKSVHQFMYKCFTEAGVELLDVYYCPHHSNIEECICRKPDSLMLEKAIAKHNIDKKKSYFIGDSRRDMLAASKVGIKGIQIVTNDSLLKYLNKIN